MFPVLWASFTVSSLPPNELKVSSLADIPQCSPLTVPLWMSRVLTFMVIATARAALSSLFVPHSPLLTSTLLQDDGEERERERHRKGLGAVGECHRGTEVNVVRLAVF